MIKPLEPIASIWPTTPNAVTWTDSRGFEFMLIPSWWSEVLGWGCTVCMGDGSNPRINSTDMVFVDADEWPWVDRGQNHPSFIHMRHFQLVNRPSTTGVSR